MSQREAEGGAFGQADPDPVEASAVFSADRLYRYALRRIWSSGPVMSFVMLNPSIANETENDPTIRRCMAFARAAGCAGLAVVNLYAWRSTVPSGLRTAADPVGPDNHRWLAWALAQPGPVVAAWGALAERRRVSEVLELVGRRELQCLGVTAHGQPRHPLYVRADTRCSRGPQRDRASRWTSSRKGRTGERRVLDHL